MTERVTLLGGTLDAGPGLDRGWHVRAGLATILDAQPDIDVIVEAPDGRRAVALARGLRPDVCLLDIRMPDLDGIEATRLLAKPDVEDPVTVVVITTFDTDEYVHGALKAGARGFLLKGASPGQLVQAVHAAVEGDALIDPGVTARLLSSFARRAVTAAPSPWTRSPSAGKRCCAPLPGDGRTPRSATSFRISMSTVKFHVAGLMTKLGARNRVELADWAYETDQVH